MRSRKVLIFNSQVMFVGFVVVLFSLQNLSSCLWWLFNQEPGRLYVELQFFCAVFNFGQVLTSVCSENDHVSGCHSS